MTCTKHGGKDAGSVYCKFCDADAMENMPKRKGNDMSDTPSIISQADLDELNRRLFVAERELAAMRLRYTWEPMESAPRDRLVLIRYPSRAHEVGYVNKYNPGDGWMELPE